MSMNPYEEAEYEKEDYFCECCGKEIDWRTYERCEGYCELCYARLFLTEHME